MNQIELHPYLVQAELRALDAEHGDRHRGVVAAGAGRRAARDATITALAEKYGKTPAQVVIRWHLQLGNVVIPKSVTPARIDENFDVFDFELADDDVAVDHRARPRRAHRARPGPVQPVTARAR